MKRFLVFFLLLALASCASIPKETVTLSKMVGNDLQALHDSHRNTIKMYYSKIEENINTFIEDVYAPYIIHYVLKIELDKYKEGEESLYGAIVNAGKSDEKEVTEEALNVMLEFTEAANEQIAAKKKELLTPILRQEKEVLATIDRSYRNAIYANATLTAYLESNRALKETQSKALSVVGLEGLDNTVTNRLIELSDFIDLAIKKGNEIDIKSDKAQKQIEEIVNKMKELTNKIKK
ncbi:hypothetical protein [Porphyromonas sp.]|uniref:hypothetical protein n=1 Tax=Porphyromonas sp. TaxID=1924944 RepID=UPI0026DD2B30|nr:hypothetical protein [Porphyromonas sp.]MDO4770828.1 hypothetical protein [Porphyromonas sp.]